MRIGRDVPRPRRLNDFLNERRPARRGRFEKRRFDLNLGIDNYLQFHGYWARVS